MKKEGVMIEKINEIINSLNQIKEKIVKLEQDIYGLKYAETIVYVFDSLAKITGNEYIKSIIFVDGGNVKYISEDPGADGYENVLIIDNKVYEYNSYKEKDGYIVLNYSHEYKISEDIINSLKVIPESTVDHADPSYFKLYHLLKQGYKIDFVKAS